MDEHPIPQPISSYQFHLIGDMTLRQFGQLAGGVILALFVYSLPMTPIFKWSLVGFFVTLGLALAFLPIEDRPLDQWIIAFAKSIYSPSIFLWQTKPKLPACLSYELPPNILNESLQQPVKIDTATLQDYLESLGPSQKGDLFEQQEQVQLAQIGSLFQNIVQGITPQPQLVTSLPKTAPRPAPQTPPPAPSVKRFPHQINVLQAKEALLRTAPLGSRRLETNSAARPIPLSAVKPKTASFPRAISPGLAEPAIWKNQGLPPVAGDLPLPQTPTRPNLIVGMVTDPHSRIIENAIIEIRNADGLPVRALRSNQLGQFQIATPLPNGQYEIEVEKPGFQFAIMKLNLTGQIVPPIEINAK